MLARTEKQRLVSAPSRSFEIFVNLEGSWTFERIITDFLHTNLSGVVQGYAHFLSNGQNSYHCIEEGKFTTRDGTFDMHQNFLYIFDAPEQITVHRTNQTEPIFTLRFFHCPAKSTARAKHHCGQDLYKATYNFSRTNGDSFGTQCRVNGQNKNYISKSVFKKMLPRQN